MRRSHFGAGAQPSADPDYFPQTGFVRLSSILAPDGPIPVGRSTRWAGVKSGRFPKPVKLGPRITAWRVEDIRALVERGVA
jgi:prophage regulatory protein